MNLFKPAIRREIYLFMFILGGLAILKQPLHRGEDSEGVDGRVHVISNERAPRPPQPSSCRTGPQVLLRAQQLVWGKQSGFIVYPPHLPRFGSWEMPKAHPAASISVVLRAELLEKSWLGFLQFSPDCDADDAVSMTKRAFVLLTDTGNDKLKKSPWKTKNYRFFSTGPQQLMMINAGDIWPLPSEAHSNFCKLH